MSATAANGANRATSTSGAAATAATDANGGPDAASGAPVTSSDPAGRRVNRWAMAVIVPMLLAGAALNGLTMFLLGRATPVALAFGSAVAAVLVALVWWLMSRSILWRPAGAWPLLAIGWGAFAAFVFVLAAGEAMSTISAAIGWEAAEAALGGAWPEEVGKVAGIALILLALPRLWNRPWDGLIVGIFVGLGFELIENIQYGVTGALEDANSDVDGMLFLWFIRAVAGPGLHVFFSGVAGFGLGLALLHPSLTTSRRLTIGLAAPIAAFVMHFLWNYAWPAAWGIWPVVVLWPVFAASLIACWVVARKMARAFGAADGLRSDGGDGPAGEGVSVVKQSP